MNNAARLNAIIEQAAAAFVAAVEERAEQLLAERMPPPRLVPEDRLLLTGREVAALVGFSEQTLANWRSASEPGAPPYVKIGGMVRYRRDALEEWISSHETM